MRCSKDRTKRSNWVKDKSRSSAELANIHPTQVGCISKRGKDARATVWIWVLKKAIASASREISLSSCPFTSLERHFYPYCFPPLILSVSIHYSPMAVPSLLYVVASNDVTDYFFFFCPPSFVICRTTLNQTFADFAHLSACVRSSICKLARYVLALSFLLSSLSLKKRPPPRHNSVVTKLVRRILSIRLFVS